jgi:cell wall-associated NlpC family hydrolase
LVGIEISKKQIRKGDLIFFRGRNSKRGGIGHVGIVISEKDEPIKFIHSSSSNGVRIDALESPYYKKRYVKTTRVTPLK